MCPKFKGFSPESEGMEMCFSSSGSHKSVLYSKRVNKPQETVNSK